MLFVRPTRSPTSITNPIKHKIIAARTVTTDRYILVSTKIRRLTNSDHLSMVPSVRMNALIHWRCQHRIADARYTTPRRRDSRSRTCASGLRDWDCRHREWILRAAFSNAGPSVSIMSTSSLACSGVIPVSLDRNEMRKLFSSGEQVAKQSRSTSSFGRLGCLRSVRLELAAVKRGTDISRQTYRSPRKLRIAITTTTAPTIQMILFTIFSLNDKKYLQALSSRLGNAQRKHAPGDLYICNDRVRSHAR